MLFWFLRSHSSMSAPIKSFRTCLSACSASAFASRSRFSWSLSAMRFRLRSCRAARAFFRASESSSWPSSSLDSYITSVAPTRDATSPATPTPALNPEPIAGPNMSSMTTGDPPPPNPPPFPPTESSPSIASSPASEVDSGAAGAAWRCEPLGAGLGERKSSRPAKPPSAAVPDASGEDTEGDAPAPSPAKMSKSFALAVRDTVWLGCAEATRSSSPPKPPSDSPVAVSAARRRIALGAGAEDTRSSNPANPSEGADAPTLARSLELPPLDANASSPDKLPRPPPEPTPKSLALPPSDDASVEVPAGSTRVLPPAAEKSDSEPSLDPSPDPGPDPGAEPPPSPRMAPSRSSLAGDAIAGGGLALDRPMAAMGVPPPGAPPPSDPNRLSPAPSPPNGSAEGRAGVAPGAAPIRGEAKKSLAGGAPGVAEGTFPVGIARVGVVVAPRPKRSSNASRVPPPDEAPALAEAREVCALEKPPCFIEFMDAPFLEEGALKSKSSNRLSSPLIAIVVRCLPGKGVCREATRSGSNLARHSSCARGERAPPTSRSPTRREGGSRPCLGRARCAHRSHARPSRVLLKAPAAARLFGYVSSRDSHVRSTSSSRVVSGRCGRC
mmetsp:Transcript_12757/g.53465  ORF Transcript_12757/g.53465 Transcript_12757/m.53465 type:complete len:612 (+) Transcript_12757:369-2204(+)